MTSQENLTTPVPLVQRRKYRAYFFFVFLLLVLSPHILKAQTHLITAEKVTTEQGLASLLAQSFSLPTWFIGLLFATLFTLITIIVQWRLRKLEKEKIRLETEVQQRTQLIQNQTEQLKSLDKAKSKFSNITHEFRTPLTLIIGSVQQILEKKQVLNDTNKQLQGVVHNAEHLLQLVNQPLDLSKIENGNSEVAIGTSFEVLLPVLPKEVAVSSIETTKKAERIGLSKDGFDINLSDITKNAHRFNENVKLLIIEDNAVMRTSIRQCLDGANYAITEAIDGVEGIQKAKNLVPDMIITDIMMPKKDGFEVISALRNHLSTSHIPIIVLTASAALDKRLMGIELGADAYLTKPFSPPELVIRVQKLLEMRQLLQQPLQKGRSTGIKKQNTQEADFLKQVKEYILEHLDESALNGEQIGQHFAMSRVQLHRKLKALTDQSASQFIKTIRLEKSLTLIEERKLNLSEIAFQTGFNSLSYFSRTFKIAYGKSPSRLLKVRK